MLTTRYSFPSFSYWRFFTGTGSIWSTATILASLALRSCRRLSSMVCCFPHLSLDLLTAIQFCSHGLVGTKNNPPHKRNSKDEKRARYHQMTTSKHNNIIQLAAMITNHDGFCTHTIAKGPKSLFSTTLSTRRRTTPRRLLGSPRKSF